MSNREAAAPSERPLPQRYALNRDIGRMYESEHGPWVRYEDCAANAPQAVRMPELPRIPPEDCIPYEAIRYVPGYTASYVMQYAINYAEASLRLNGIVPLAPQDSTKEGL